MTFIKRHKLAVILLLVCVVGIGWIVWSVRRNTALRLDLPRLKAARELWEERGPKAYHLVYTILRTGGTKADRYEVEVVDGKAVSASVNGRADDADRLHNYGMEKLYSFIERFLEIDKDASTVQRADFGAEDGRLLWYLRNAPAKKQSVEITVLSLE